MPSTTGEGIVRVIADACATEQRGREKADVASETGTVVDGPESVDAAGRRGDATPDTATSKSPASEVSRCQRVDVPVQPVAADRIG